jgi:hypothetical protein
MELKNSALLLKPALFTGQMAVRIPVLRGGEQRVKSRHSDKFRIHLTAFATTLMALTFASALEAATVTWVGGNGAASTLSFGTVLEFAPESLKAGDKLTLTGSWNDSLQGVLIGSSTYEIVSPTTAMVAGEIFSFTYVKTGPHSATLSYRDSEDIGGGVSYEENGSTRLNFDTTAGGTFTSLSSYVYIGFPEEESGTITGNGLFSYNDQGGGVGVPPGGGGGTLADAVDAPQLTWTSGGGQPWVFQTALTHDGVDAAASGRIQNGQESWLETTLRGPGTLKFWWKVSSEVDYDYLQFYVNGTQQQSISGNEDWQERTFTLADGNHSVRWVYTKDEVESSGEDRGWLDRVSFGPPVDPPVTTVPPVITLQPLRHTVITGSTVTFSVAAAGTAPISYQWRKGTTVLMGATNDTYTISNVQTNDAGDYVAVASNPGGTQMSESARLTVISQHETKSIPNPTPVREDEDFGAAIAALDDGRIIIGDPDHTKDTRDNRVGRAYLFSPSGSLLSAFENPSSSVDEGFAEVVAGFGNDRVIIGAPDYSSSTIEEIGIAYLYKADGNLLTTFTNPTPRDSENFGIAVAAVGGDRVLIGAWGEDDTSINSAGAAYLFATNGTLMTIFTNPTPAFGDGFGRAVAPLGSDRVMISAINDGMGSGAVHLFTLAGQLLTTITNPTRQTSTAFGWSIAAVGRDKVLVGEPLHKQDVHEVGAAYLFDTNGVLLASINNPIVPSNLNIPRDANYIFGFGFAVTGVGQNRLLIGATGGRPTRAFLYGSDGGLLTTFTNSHSLNTGFGRALASTSNKIIIGEPDAWTPDGFSTDAGAAHLLDLLDASDALKIDATRLGDQMTVHWSTIPGRKYRLVRATTVPAGDWTPVPGGDVTGTGGPASKAIPLDAAEAAVFLRVELVP